jgi:light-regulated signal transduction histidine kinase (bacteriophytochrome)
MATSDHDALNQALARIAELENALQASERAAQSASQELQHFVYAASHDLQEPLRAITTYTQLLDRLYAHDQQTQELTAFITTGVARMNSLLQSLLTYSRVNLSPALTEVSLNAAIQAALYKLANIIKESGAVVHFTELPTIPAHEVQIGQLFHQLLSNSILYRRDQPVIEITAEGGDLNGEPSQTIRVKDNGVGIEPQFLQQVIQPFKRLHGKDIPGNGLGLAICDKIMRAHRGKLWIESDGATSTTVCLTFPA